MTECERYRDDILEAATVRGPMAVEAREHVQSCEECRGLFAAAESIVRGVRSVQPESPSPATTDRILAAAREEIERRPEAVSGARRWVMAGVVAASLALFVAGTWLLRRGEESMDTKAVAALEEQVDRGLDRVRSEMDPVWPTSGWGVREARGVSSRIDSFQARIERFRTRSRTETFPLDFTPGENDRQQEGRGEFRPVEWRHLS